MELFRSFEAWQKELGEGSLALAIEEHRASVTAPVQFPSKLEELICRARNALIEITAPAKVADDALTSEARKDGVPIEQRPDLGSPNSAGAK